MDMALFLRLELEVDPFALPFGVVWRGAAAGGADCSPVAATATAADVRPPEVARPVRRNGPELAANRRANLRASRRARRAPAAPAPTLTVFLSHPPWPGGGTRCLVTASATLHENSLLLSSRLASPAPLRGSLPARSLRPEAHTYSASSALFNVTLTRINRRSELC